MCYIIWNKTKTNETHQIREFKTHKTTQTRDTKLTEKAKLWSETLTGPQSRRNCSENGATDSCVVDYRWKRSPNWNARNWVMASQLKSMKLGHSIPNWKVGNWVMASPIHATFKVGFINPYCKHRELSNFSVTKQRQADQLRVISFKNTEPAYSKRMLSSQKGCWQNDIWRQWLSC